jgi:predicted nucleic acid-binding protein
VTPILFRHSGAYAAAYLDLALRQGLPLTTLDEQLRRAAKTTGVVLLS